MASPGFIGFSDENARLLEYVGSASRRQVLQRIPEGPVNLWLLVTFK
jgi:hypothetical protein